MKQNWKKKIVLKSVNNFIPLPDPTERCARKIENKNFILKKILKNLRGLNLIPSESHFDKCFRIA